MRADVNYILTQDKRAATAAPSLSINLKFNFLAAVSRILFFRRQVRRKNFL